MRSFTKVTKRFSAVWFGRHFPIIVATAIFPSLVFAAGPVELEIDGKLRLAAAKVAEPKNGVVQVELFQATDVPLLVPVERIRCHPGPGCPVQLAANTSDAKSLQGFEIQGSNTIGDKLMPELVVSYVKNAFQVEPEQATLNDPDEKQLTFEPPGGGSPIDIFIRAHGSGTGFEPLVGVKQAATSQVWMSSRRVKEDEYNQAKTKSGLDLRAADSEHVVALDGLGVIVNRQNPVTALTIDEIAKIFSGKITRWQDIKSAQDSSGNAFVRGDIKLYRRDDKSGTTSTFNDLIFSPSASKDESLKACVEAKDKNPGGCFSNNAKPFESTPDLEQKVATDPLSIGFIGIGYKQNTKALGVIAECAADATETVQRFAYSPNEFNIKTEEYPLSRRLYLYTAGEPKNNLAKNLVVFSTSTAARPAILRQGFIDQSILPANYDAQGERFASMIGAASAKDQSTRDFLNDTRFATRLSVTFRFADKVDTLDAKARSDLRLLAQSLNSTYKDRQFILLGFSDNADDPQRALQLSVQRASAVAHALKEAGVKVFSDNAHAYGSAAPVACNDSEPGRALNRRVEVWIK